MLFLGDVFFIPNAQEVMRLDRKSTLHLGQPKVSMDLMPSSNP